MNKLSNKELYARCLELSIMIRKYRNQFIALLPEVAARRLYLEHGMHSIYEFAAKLGCLSNKTVDRVLKVNEKLESKPILKSMFQSGEIGWSKLEIATRIQADEKYIAAILPTISFAALQLKIKDSKENGTVIFDEKLEKLSFEITSEKLSRLRVFKNHLEKEMKQPLTWEQTLEIMLNKIELPLPKKAKHKRQALNRTNQLCAKCTKPAEHLHHQIPYSICKSHESIIPLCKAHHDLEHHKNNSYINTQYQMHKRIALKS